MSVKPIRIGGASGFWGDAARATPMLLADGNLDFIVYDYLAEITMSIMARARAKDARKGYAVDFVHSAMGDNLAEIERQGVRIIANAGGVNPQACAQALREIIKERGHALKVACVIGDDLLDHKADFSSQNISEMFSGETFPLGDKIQSINAYLGAFPIAKALDLGADIVITGRCVDSAVTLGACIHCYQWAEDQYDKLAMGSLAGHILECGPQATGGNFTDWHLVAHEIDTLGYPIAEIEQSGQFVCTKPAQTGGLVNVGTVAEQMLYEIGDPQAYLLPDVSCDFSSVKLREEGTDRVCVTGARGSAPPRTYKVCATYADQFRGGTLVTVSGIDADKKAQALAAAVLRAARRVLRACDMDDFSETSIEIIGAESQYGAHRSIAGSREVALKVAVKHVDALGINILLKEFVGLGLATPPALSGFQSARPKASPVVRLFSFLLPRSAVTVYIDLEGELIRFANNVQQPIVPAAVVRPQPPVLPSDEDLLPVRLVELAWGRSGDKGNKANIAIIARDAKYLPFIYATLTEAFVRDRFAHFFESAPNSEKTDDVERFLLPGCNAINFLLHNVLGGGGIASLRNDAQAKAYAQILLDVTIPVSKEIAQSITTSRSGITL